MARKRRMTVEVAGDVRGAQGALSDLRIDVEQTEGRFSGMADKVATGWALIGGGQLAMDAIGMVNSVGTAAELAGLKAETVFGAQAASMEAWADATNEAFGVSDSDLLGMAANMGDLLKPMGASTEEAAAMAQEMVGLSGALSAWSGGSKDAAEVSEILSAAMLGERDALTSLGVKIDQAAVDERALAIARAQGRDEVTQMDQALATQRLIMEQTADAQRAWTDGTMDSVIANNEMKAAVVDLKEDVATALLPALQAVTTFMVEDGIPALKGAAEFVEQRVIPVMVWFGQEVGKAAEDAWAVAGPPIGYIIDRLGNIIDIASAAVTFVSSVFKGDWDAAWGAVKDAFVANWELVTAPFGVFADVVGGAANAAWELARPPLELITGAIGEIVDLWDTVSGIDFGSAASSAASAIPGGGLLSDAAGFLGFHSGGTFHSATPGGEGLALLRDGEKVFTPASARAHGRDFDELPVRIEVNIDGETIARTVERVSTRRKLNIRGLSY